jgi:hypothetical protein
VADVQRHVRSNVVYLISINLEFSLVLYMLYFPHELKFDQINGLVHGKSPSRTPEWRRSIFVSIVVGLHL